MNKLTLSILATVLLLGGAYFSYHSINNGLENDPMNPSKNKPYTSNQNIDKDFENSIQQKSGKTTSLAELSRQGAQKCDLTITPEGQNLSYKGKFYTDGSGKFKRELETGPDNSIYYLIASDKALYNWSNKDNKGFKQVVESESVEDYDTAMKGSDLTQVYDYNCTSWQVDSSLFIPPSNITFTAFTK